MSRSRKDTLTATLQKKSLDTPEETRTPPKTKVEVVKFGEVAVMRVRFEPGWKWSEHIKPVAGTESCQVPHLGYVISGRMHVVKDDGTETDLGPGDTALIPPGHNAWVVGSEPCVQLDFQGGHLYAK